MKSKKDEIQTALVYLLFYTIIAALIFGGKYAIEHIIPESWNETTKSEDYNEGYEEGFEDGYNQGYFDYELEHKN